MPCFECGSPGPLHDHHVIPQCLGGTKTVPLCEVCHGKIHGLDYSNHRELTRIGIQRNRPADGRWGGALSPKLVKITPEIKASMIARRDDGANDTTIAREFSLNKSWVGKCFRKWGVEKIH